MSPLTQGRELKHFGWAERLIDIQSPLTQGRELKLAYRRKENRLENGRPSRRGVN